MSATLTERQRSVLDYLRCYTAAEGRPPTLREIAGRFGFSTTRARHVIARLRELGMVRTGEGARSAAPV